MPGKASKEIPFATRSPRDDSILSRSTSRWQTEIERRRGPVSAASTSSRTCSRRRASATYGVLSGKPVRMAWVTEPSTDGGPRDELPSGKNDRATRVGRDHIGPPPAPARYPLTKARRRLFLDALSAGFAIRAAASSAEIARSSAYHLRRREPEFEQEWLDALDESVDRAEERLVEIIFARSTADRDRISAAALVLRGRRARYR